MKEYKLQKDLTIAKLKANKFSFKELNTYILTVPLYFYKSSKHKKYVTVQMLICINLNESDYEFEIIDENNNMYTPYYNREYGYSKLNKILDKKIIQEFKFLEKQGIMRKVKGKIKHENSC